jgi:hypothetical protein
MDIHEYQAKELLARFGVPIPPGAGLPMGPSRPPTGATRSAGTAGS